jgi:EAL domain-containing protein (putative c-di-GMP-specific phosphodiesterase class I)
MLGMEVVAEGVEDSDDWRFVSAAGCGIAQGYFIGRPMPGPAIAAWHEEWKARVRQENLAGFAAPP